jgi:hypothetical protein
MAGDAGLDDNRPLYQRNAPMHARYTALIVLGWLLAAPAPASAAETYHDRSYGFAVTPPTFPASTALGMTTTPVQFAAMTKDGGTPNCNVTVQTPAMTESDYLELTRNQFQAIGGANIKEEARTVSGKSAVLWHYTVAGGEVMTLAVFAEKRVYLATCASPALQWPDWEATFKVFIDSFVLEPAAAPAKTAEPAKP